MNKTYVLIIIGILSVLIIVFGFTASKYNDIDSFEECIDAGYPIMESYPRQCSDNNGNLFTEDVKNWKTDGVVLMRIPETGELGCFGCGRTQCRDPIPTLEQIEETEARYCTEDFEINEPTKTSSGMPVPGNDSIDEMIVNK